MKLSPPDVQLNVEIDGDEIVVTLPGTRFKMTFQKSSDGAPWLMEKSNYVSNDPDAPITPYEFVPLAFKAATDRARELGWKV
jgi:hypothetical protein